MVFGDYTPITADSLSWRQFCFISCGPLIKPASGFALTINRSASKNFCVFSDILSADTVEQPEEKVVDSEVNGIYS